MYEIYTIQIMYRMYRYNVLCFNVYVWICICMKKQPAVISTTKDRFLYQERFDTSWQITNVRELFLVESERVVAKLEIAINDQLIL